MPNVESIVWGIIAAVSTLAFKYFFERWNASAERLDPKGDNFFITNRECRHSRGNCTNTLNLQFTNLTEKFEERFDTLRRELHDVRGILLIVASKVNIPMEQLKDLTK